MRVIFLEDIPNVARTGDVKEVKTGYARNYLLPKKLAVLATSREMERLESIKRAGLIRLSKQLDGAEALKQRMEESPLALQVRAGPTGKLYGAVTSALVAEELSRQLDVEVDRRNVVLDEGIQELGSFEVTVKLHSQITATVALLVEQIQE